MPSKLGTAKSSTIVSWNIFDLYMYIYLLAKDNLIRYITVHCSQHQWRWHRLIHFPNDEFHSGHSAPDTCTWLWCNVKSKWEEKSKWMDQCEGRVGGGQDLFLFLFFTQELEHMTIKHYSWTLRRTCLKMQKYSAVLGSNTVQHYVPVSVTMETLWLFLVFFPTKLQN